MTSFIEAYCTVNKSIFITYGTFTRYVLDKAIKTMITLKERNINKPRTLLDTDQVNA